MTATTPVTAEPATKKNHRTPGRRLRLMGLVLILGGVLAVTGIKAPWYMVTPTATSGMTSHVLINGVALSGPTTFTGLDLAKSNPTATVTLTPPTLPNSSGVQLPKLAPIAMNPLNVASPSSPPGTVGGWPLTLFLLLAAILLGLAGAVMRSILLSLGGLVAAFMAWTQFAALQNWPHTPALTGTTITPLAGIFRYEVGVCVSALLLAGIFLSLAIPRLLNTAAKVNTILHTEEGESLVQKLAYSLSDRNSPALSDEAVSAVTDSLHREY